MPDGPLVAKIGNVTKPLVLRFSPGGKAVVKFGIAVNPYVPAGQPKPEPQFYDVTAFGSLAENAAATLQKGTRVVVIGTGKTEEWTDKNHQTHTSKVIIADGLGPDMRFATATLHKDAPQSKPENIVAAAFGVDESEEPF